LIVLAALAEAGRATLTDISLSVGLPSATAYRILATLQKQGFADFDDITQEWMIGVEAFRTGAAFLRRTTLQEVSQPVLRGLMEQTGETANLAVPHGGEVVFIGQRETPNPIRAFFHPGTRTPMHASGTGKAILAEMGRDELARLLAKQGLARFTANTLTDPARLFEDLAETRARGYSFDDQERFDGMSCTGAVIRDATGAVVAGISVSGPSARFTPQTVPALGLTVVQAAREVSDALGAS
jgi:IclR family acetate operon transcriptional repressor